MSYYNACREHVKLMKAQSFEFRKRMEAKREEMAKRMGDPMQLLRIHGTGMNIVRDTKEYDVQNSGANLIPWRGQPNNMVDKHDCRSNLDFIPTRYLFLSVNFGIGRWSVWFLFPSSISKH